MCAALTNDGMYEALLSPVCLSDCLSHNLLITTVCCSLAATFSSTVCVQGFFIGNVSVGVQWNTLLLSFVN